MLYLSHQHIIVLTMINSKDFLEREIEKLNLMILKLIILISKSNPNDFENDIKETDEFLKTNFDLTIGEISTMSNSNFIEKIRDLHESHTDKLVELLFEIIQKMDSIETEQGFNKHQLIEKSLLLIEYIDNNSTTFSVSRLNIKNTFQQLI